MIRRFNFTGRENLPHSMFDIRLESGPDRRFTVGFDLSEYTFPPEAKLYFEASSSGSGLVVRFPWGTVSKPQPSVEPSLKELPGQSAIFTFKVVDESGLHGKLLGTARGISLRSGGQGEGETRQSLLPVNPVPLGQQVWRVSFPEETPWLEVNREIPEIMNRAQGDPFFLSLVYPAVLRQILTEALVVREFTDAEDLGSWEGRWLNFGQHFHPVGDEPPQEDDVQMRAAWIDAVVDHFCSHFQLRDRFEAMPYAGLDQGR